MIRDPSSRGLCGVIQCGSCPMLISGACAGCRQRNAAEGGDGNKRCGIVVCCEARHQTWCLDCEDFPCSVFRSPSSCYLPPTAQSDSSWSCSLSALTRKEAIKSTRFVSRLAGYLTVAEQTRSLGNKTVSSAEFASALGITPQLVRKDLLGLGHFGIPHVGFRVDKCIEALRATLNLKTVRNVIWIGARSADPPESFTDRMETLGCRVVAVLDEPDGAATEKSAFGAVRVFGFDQIARVVKNLAVVGAVITCNDTKVQYVADTVIQLGITSLLNLTPVSISHPPNVFVHSMDPSEDIMLFSFYCRGR